MIELIEHNLLLVLFLPVWVCLFIFVNKFVRFTDTRKLTFAFTMFTTTIGLIFSSCLLYSILQPVQKTIEYSVPWFQCGDMGVYFGIFIDNISALFLFVLMSVSFCVHLFSYEYMKNDEEFHKYYLYLNLFNFSMSALIVSSNLIQTYIFWELVGVASYLLIGFWYKRENVSNAAKRVFWTNRIGDFAFLLGIIILTYYSLAYPLTITQSELLSYSNLEYFVMKLQTLMTGETYIFISVLLLIGAFVKSAQFPFQTWLVDAMKAPTPVSALIHSATMVCAGLFLVLRLYPMFIVSDVVMKTILWVGVLTALSCALFAVTQRNIKKMLAYSTSSQLGLMFAALGLLSPTAAIFYMCAHAYTKAALFLTTGNVSKIYSGELNMNKLGGIRRNNLLLALFWLIAALSLSGICFSGFSAKEILFAPFFNLGETTVFIILLAVSFFTSVYIFKAYFKIFEGNSKSESSDNIISSMIFGLFIITLYIITIVLVLNGNVLKMLTPRHFFFTEYFNKSLLITLLSVSIFGAMTGFLSWKYRNLLKLFPKFIVKFFYRGAFISSVFKVAISDIFLFICRVFRFIDENIFDGIVKLSVKITKKCSETVQKLQNGNFQTYLAYTLFSIGIILFLAFQIYLYVAKEMQ